MPTCPHCNCDSPAGSAFCSSCGVAFAESEPTPDATQKCASCGAEISPDDKFCPRCGTNLGPEAAVPPPAAPLPEAPPIKYRQEHPTPPTKKKLIWPWVLGIFALCFCLCGGLLSAILFPVFDQARKAAKSTSALSTAKQVDLAMLMYSGDFDDTFPPLSDSRHLSELIQPYTKLPNIAGLASSYEWNQSLSGQSATSIEDPRTTWIFASKQPDALGKYDVGFADGHAQSVIESDLVQIKATSKNPVSEGQTTSADLTGDIHRIWKESVTEEGVETSVQYDFRSPSNYVSIWYIRGKSDNSKSFVEKFHGTGTYSYKGDQLILEAATDPHVAIKPDGASDWLTIDKTSSDKDSKGLFNIAKTDMLCRRVFKVKAISASALLVESDGSPDEFTVASGDAILKP